MAKGNGHQEKDNETLDSDTENNNPLKQEEIPSESSEKSPRKPLSVTITDIELENLKKEISEYKDKYLRLLAENENTRKRMQKERQELIQYALQNVIADFLNPIDHMENALNFTQQMSEEIKHWAFGFQMILNQFKEVLTNNGVVPFSSKGTPFDPHMHEAIEMIETVDHPAGSVVEESLRGYKMAEKVIRPARVKVAKSPRSKSEDFKDEKNFEEEQIK
jgi:molecular chaperone GrpE